MRQRGTLLQRFVTLSQICELFESEAELRAGQCAKHLAVHLVLQVPVGLNGVLDRLHNLRGLRPGVGGSVRHKGHSAPIPILRGVGLVLVVLVDVAPLVVGAAAA